MLKNQFPYLVDETTQTRYDESPSWVVDSDMSQPRDLCNNCISHFVMVIYFSLIIKIK